jgi:two-component system LytT family response regulator
LRHLLAEIEWLDCVGEASNGPAAVIAIDTLRPDLVFLDIQMPGMLGTEVLARVQHQPFAVFTTAHAQHAVTAFELGALDYLLKPFGEERLHVALERVRAALGEPRTSLDRFTEAMSHAPMSRLFVRSGRSIVPLAVSDVAWFEAVGDYIAAHIAGAQAGAAPHLLHVPLSQLEARLDARRFARIHRAHLVNLDHVAAFRREPGGNLIAELSDGTCLPVSRAKARDLRSLAR